MPTNPILISIAFKNQLPRLFRLQIDNDQNEQGLEGNGGEEPADGDKEQQKMSGSKGRRSNNTQLTIISQRDNKKYHFKLKPNKKTTHPQQSHQINNPNNNHLKKQQTQKSHSQHLKQIIQLFLHISNIYLKSLTNPPSTFLHLLTKVDQKWKDVKALFSNQNNEIDNRIKNCKGNSAIQCMVDTIISLIGGCGVVQCYLVDREISKFRLLDRRYVAAQNKIKQLITLFANKQKPRDVVFFFSEPLVEKSRGREALKFTQDVSYQKQYEKFIAVIKNMPRNINVQILVATQTNIKRVLMQKVSIVHFSCHGAPPTSSSQNGLNIEKDLGVMELLTADSLLNLLHNKALPKVIVFNGCYTHRIAEKLNQKLKLTAIGIDGEGVDEYCELFTENFYKQAFLQQKSIMQIFQCAKAEIFKKDTVEGNKFKIYCTNDGRCLENCSNNTAFEWDKQWNRLNCLGRDEPFGVKKMLYDFIQTLTKDTVREVLLLTSDPSCGKTTFIRKTLIYSQERNLFRVSHFVDCRLDASQRPISTLLQFRLAHHCRIIQALNSRQQQAGCALLAIDNCEELIKNQEKAFMKYLSRLLSSRQFGIGKIVLVGQKTLEKQRSSGSPDQELTAFLQQRSKSIAEPFESQHELFRTLSTGRYSPGYSRQNEHPPWYIKWGLKLWPKLPINVLKTRDFCIYVKRYCVKELEEEIPRFREINQLPEQILLNCFKRATNKNQLQTLYDNELSRLKNQNIKAAKEQALNQTPLSAMLESVKNYLSQCEDLLQRNMLERDFYARNGLHFVPAAFMPLGMPLQPENHHNNRQHRQSHVHTTGLALQIPAERRHSGQVSAATASQIRNIQAVKKIELDISSVDYNCLFINADTICCKQQQFWRTQSREDPNITDSPPSQLNSEKSWIHSGHQINSPFLPQLNNKISPPRLLEVINVLQRLLVAPSTLYALQKYQECEKYLLRLHGCLIRLSQAVMPYAQLRYKVVNLRCIIIITLHAVYFHIRRKELELVNYNRTDLTVGEHRINFAEGLYKENISVLQDELSEYLSEGYKELLKTVQIAINLGQAIRCHLCRKDHLSQQITSKNEAFNMTVAQQYEVLSRYINGIDRLEGFVKSNKELATFIRREQFEEMYVYSLEFINGYLKIAIDCGLTRLSQSQLALIKTARNFCLSRVQNTIFATFRLKLKYAPNKVNYSYSALDSLYSRRYLQILFQLQKLYEAISQVSNSADVYEWIVHKSQPLALTAFRRQVLQYLFAHHANRCVILIAQPLLFQMPGHKKSHIKHLLDNQLRVSSRIELSVRDSVAKTRRNILTESDLMSRDNLNKRRFVFMYVIVADCFLGDGDKSEGIWLEDSSGCFQKVFLVHLGSKGPGSQVNLPEARFILHHGFNSRLLLDCYRRHYTSKKGTQNHSQCYFISFPRVQYDHHHNSKSLFRQVYDYVQLMDVNTCAFENFFESFSRGLLGKIESEKHVQQCFHIALHEARIKTKMQYTDVEHPSRLLQLINNIFDKVTYEHLIGQNDKSLTVNEELNKIRTLPKLSVVSSTRDYKKLDYHFGFNKSIFKLMRIIIDIFKDANDKINELLPKKDSQLSKGSKDPSQWGSSSNYSARFQQYHYGYSLEEEQRPPCIYLLNDHEAKLEAFIQSFLFKARLNNICSSEISQFDALEGISNIIEALRDFPVTQTKICIVRNVNEEFYRLLDRWAEQKRTSISANHFQSIQQGENLLVTSVEQGIVRHDEETKIFFICICTENFEGQKTVSQEDYSAAIGDISLYVALSLSLYDKFGCWVNVNIDETKQKQLQWERMDEWIKKTSKRILQNGAKPPIPMAKLLARASISHKNVLDELSLTMDEESERSRLFREECFTPQPHVHHVHHVHNHISQSHHQDNQAVIRPHDHSNVSSLLHVHRTISDI